MVMYDVPFHPAPPLEVRPKLTVKTNEVVRVVVPMQQVYHPSKERATGSNYLTSVVKVTNE